MRIRSLVAAIPAMLTALFLLGYIHPFGDAGLFHASPLPPLKSQSSVPPEVRAVLVAKCADCHSLATRTPIYARFAPGSWLIERDIIRGRGAMTLSQWESDSIEQQEAFKAKIAHVVRKREMPPVQYLAIHWGARLSPEDIRAITEWAGPPASADPKETSAASAAGDLERGKVVFEKRCTGCHALNQDREGPHLQGVYGRTAGTVSGFDYSDALKKTHIVWNQETLDHWLTDPQTMVPGADMDFYVAKPGERADVIAYLRQQSGK
jgi:cytochrome c